MSDLETQLPLLCAMGAAKRRDPTKFAKLMKELGVDSWQHLNPSKYPDAIASCALIVGEDNKPTVDEIVETLADDLTTKNVRDQLNKMARDRIPKTGGVKNLAEFATGKTDREKIESMARFDEAARKVQANAKAAE